MSSIPKVIHYCWFGTGQKSSLMTRCIESWRRMMPDFEIKEWNEENFDLTVNRYAYEAYQEKKYAFVSDYARLKIIYEEGGIYLDTDVEIVRPLTKIIETNGYLAFERENRIATGLGFAAPPFNSVVKSMLDAYNDIHFVNEGVIDNTPCPVRNSQMLEQVGFKMNNTIQTIAGITTYPISYFCPMNPDTGKISMKEETHTIHHYSYSWADSYSKKVKQRKQFIFKWTPSFCSQNIFDIINHICKLFGR